MDGEGYGEEGVGYGEGVGEKIWGREWDLVTIGAIVVVE